MLLKNLLNCKFTDSCEVKPVVVVDKGLWYRWVLERLGITYFHETYSERSKIKRWFRRLKERRRFYNNINTEKVKNIGEIVEAIATLHNLINQTIEVIPT